MGTVHLLMRQFSRGEKKGFKMKQTNQIFTKRFIALFATNISVFVVFYALLTALPLYVMNVLEGTEDAAGILVTVFLITAIVVRPFCGKLLERYGKKRMLLLSLFFYIVSAALYLVIKPFVLLILLRMFQGIWFSIVTTASGAIAADIIPPHRRGTGLGYFTMSTSLAVVLGPLVALYVIQAYSFNLLFTILTIFVLIGGLCALTIDGRDLAGPNKAARLSFKLSDLFEAKAMPIAIFAMLTAISYSSILSFMSLYAAEKNLLEAASYFYVVFAIAMLAVRPFTGKLFDRFGSKVVILPAFFIFGVGLLVMSFVQSMWTMLLAGALIGIGFGTLSTSLQTQAVQNAMKHRTAYATATYFTLFDIGIAVGSYLFGLLVMQMDFSTIYFISALLIMMLFVAFFVYSNRNSVSLKRFEEKTNS